MALYFDILKLENYTGDDPNYIVNALEHWYYKRLVPKNKFQKYKPLTKSLAGSSFLINPIDFFNDDSTDVLYKAQYIKLAGRRDYLLYKQYGVRYLDLSHYPDINKNIQNNPLLTIQQNKLYFKYEEDKKWH